MRLRYLLPAFFALLVVGCGGDPSKNALDGPTVDNFDGQLVQNGKPIALKSGQKAILRLVFQKNGESFGIPINENGSFDIGKMPIGNYSARLEIKGGDKRGQSITNVPDLVIEDGKTQYQVELGKDWKP